VDLGNADARSRSSRDRVWADLARIRGPVSGYFTWSADEPMPLLLLSGRAGAVPLMSMLRHLAVREFAAQSHLLVPARSAEDVLYREELETRDPRQGCASRTPTRGGASGLDRLERAHLRRDARRRLT
jgi:NAD(P)H-flavin reductase